MNTQPEALRLAVELDKGYIDFWAHQEAATELRRLAIHEHEAKENIAMLQEALAERENDLFRLHALNAQLTQVSEELLEALEKIAAIENQMYGNDWQEIEDARVIARAAIARAEGTCKAEGKQK